MIRDLYVCYSEQHDGYCIVPDWDINETEFETIYPYVETDFVKECKQHLNLLKDIQNIIYIYADLYSPIELGTFLMKDKMCNGICLSYDSYIILLNRSYIEPKNDIEMKQNEIKLPDYVFKSYHYGKVISVNETDKFMYKYDNPDILQTLISYK